MDSIDLPRKIKRELIVSVSGDEVNSAFGTVYLIRLLGPSVFRVFAIVFTIVLVIIGSRERLWYGPLFSTLFYGGIFSFLLLSASAYGAVQALIGLDLPLTVSVGPIGYAELDTVPAVAGAGLQHLQGAEHVIGAISRLLESETVKASS